MQPVKFGAVRWIVDGEAAKAKLSRFDPRYYFPFLQQESQATLDKFERYAEQQRAERQDDPQYRVNLFQVDGKLNQRLLIDSDNSDLDSYNVDLLQQVAYQAEHRPVSMYEYAVALHPEFSSILAYNDDQSAEQIVLQKYADKADEAPVTI
jgi:hypothetical protein